jgi:hypothetical protein
VRENVVHRQLRDCHNDYRYASIAEPNCRYEARALIDHGKWPVPPSMSDMAIYR